MQASVQSETTEQFEQRNKKYLVKIWLDNAKTRFIGITA